MANKFNFGKVAQNMRNVDISLAMANTAKNEFLGNFKSQSFGNNSWKPRKNNKDAGRNLLVKTGRLRRDVSNSVATGIKNSNKSYTLIVANPYAEYNNKGTDKMPQRQFVGTTPELNRKLLLKISQQLRKIWEI